MMMPFEWDVRVSSKDHTVAALYVVNDELATVGYTTLGGTTARRDGRCVRRGRSSLPGPRVCEVHRCVSSEPSRPVRAMRRMG